MSGHADGGYSRAWRRLTEVVLPPVINGLMGHEWRGQENIRNVPADSGLILAINHLSYADVLAMCLFTYKSGRYPVFLAKSSLFEMRGLRAVMRGTGQLPVYRGQSDAGLVLRDARRSLRDLLPGGDRDPRSGPVADGGQDRCGQARAGHRRPGDPRGALGGTA